MNSSPAIPAQTVADALQQLDRAWTKAGVVKHHREEMLDDVAIDLEAAASDGVDLDDLLRPSIDSFAEEVAQARAVELITPRYGTTFAGAAAGAAAGFGLGYPAVGALFDSPQSQLTWTTAVTVYAGLVLACVCTALGGIAVRLRRDQALRGTLSRSAVALPLTGLLLAPLTVGFARATGYSNALPIMLIEIGFVLGGCAAAIAACRRAAVHRAVR